MYLVGCVKTVRFVVIVMIINDGDCLWICQYSIGEENNMRELVERYDKNSHEIEYNVDLDTLDVYKKPKRVKVNFSVLKATQDRICVDFYVVRFKIENWEEQTVNVHYRNVDFGWHSVEVNPRWNYTSAFCYVTVGDPGRLRICGDAKGKWSTPVIFNRKQRDKLQDLVKYLEEKLNGD